MLTELCKATHAKLFVGRCPWCGCPITKGQIGEIPWEAVQERIKELITHEDKSNPLTDQEIVERLAAEEMAVAVRTVAKYRRKWRIPPAKDRREGNP